MDVKSAAKLLLIGIVIMTSCVDVYAAEDNQEEYSWGDFRNSFEFVGSGKRTGLSIDVGSDEFFESSESRSAEKACCCSSLWASFVVKKTFIELNVSNSGVTPSSKAPSVPAKGLFVGTVVTPRSRINNTIVMTPKDYASLFGTFETPRSNRSFNFSEVSAKNEDGCCAGISCPRGGCSCVKKKETEACVCHFMKANR
jgi:hypothetical protein